MNKLQQSQIPYSHLRASSSRTLAEVGSLSHRTTHVKNKAKVTAETSSLRALVRDTLPSDTQGQLAENPHLRILFMGAEDKQSKKHGCLKMTKEQIPCPPIPSVHRNVAHKQTVNKLGRNKQVVILSFMDMRRNSRFRFYPRALEIQAHDLAWPFSVTACMSQGFYLCGSLLTASLMQAPKTSHQKDMW